MASVATASNHLASEARRADLENALKNVAALDAYILPDNEYPLQATGNGLTYTPKEAPMQMGEGAPLLDKNFERVAGFAAELNQIADDAMNWAHQAYTWRPLARLLPREKAGQYVADQTPDNLPESLRERYRKEYSKSLNVRALNIESMVEFAIDKGERIVINMGNIFLDQRDSGLKIPLDFLVVACTRALSAMAVLDAVINMRTNLSTEYSVYQTKPYGKATLNPYENSKEVMAFISRRDSVLETMVGFLRRLKVRIPVICPIVNRSLLAVKDRRFITAEEKYQLLRGGMAALYLLDKAGLESGEPDGLFRESFIDFQVLVSVLRETPSIPMLGDIPCVLLSFLRRCPNHEDSLEVTALLSSPVQFPMLDKLTEQVKNDVNSFFANFTIFTNHLSDVMDEPENRLRHRLVLPSGVDTICSDYVLSGLRQLGYVQSKILEAYAFLLANPGSANFRDGIPDNAEEHERSLRYNMFPKEKLSLVELVGILKSLARNLMDVEKQFADVLRYSIYLETQKFVQVTMRAMIKAAIKKKNGKITSVLLRLRSAMADFHPKVNPDADPFLGISKSKEKWQAKLGRKMTLPTEMQINHMRYLLEQILNGAGLEQDHKERKKNPFTDDDLKILTKLYKKSRYYMHLASYSETVTNASDLGHLWYREKGLSLTRGLPQLPMEASLPWMLLDETVSTGNPSLLEFTMYLMSVYNDAGRMALSTLNSQYLFNEIESEASLALDEVVLRLSEEIFRHYKLKAGSLNVDKGMRAQVLKVSKAPLMDIVGVPKEYSSLMQERQLYVLGRRIDLSSLISRRVNRMLYKSYDLALAQYESSDFTGVIALCDQFQTLRIMHDELSKVIYLDSSDDLRAAADGTLTVATSSGRLLLHTAWEFVSDFLPNYCYNHTTSRFIRSPVTFVEEMRREVAPQRNIAMQYGSVALNQMYQAIQLLHTGFVGHQHIQRMIKLLDRGSLAVLVEEILKSVELLLENTLIPYFQGMVLALPPEITRVGDEETSDQLFARYLNQLRSVREYPDLQGEVLQAFRELGNTLIFMMILDIELTADIFTKASHTTPLASVPGDESTRQWTDVYSTIQKGKDISEDPRQDINREVVTLADAELERKSLFRGALLQLRDYLLRQEGLVEKADYSNPSDLSIHNTTEFHRLWSAIQFSIVCSMTSDQLDPDILFGEGLQWGGIAMLYLLGQRHRYTGLDFSYQLLRTWVTDRKDVTLENVNLATLCSKVSIVKARSLNIIDILDRYMGDIVQSFVSRAKPPTADWLYADEP
eukprot:Clim_evm10s47 gene=Clim_evmTU10s47